MLLENVECSREIVVGIYEMFKGMDMLLLIVLSNVF